MKRSAIALALVAFVNPATQTKKPSVVPFFDDGQPSFVITCWNNSTTAVQPSVNSFVRLWLDGSLNEPGGRGGSGPVRPMIPAGESWRETFTLSPESGSPHTSRSYVGVVNSTYRAVNLATGLHVVSFDCGNAKSDEFSFYWKEPAGRP
jgi:hypothetical protein